jgi:hypothetical protein
LRIYTLEPGETVPCAVHAGDDLIVTVLRADFSDSTAVRLTTGSDSPVPGIDEIAVSPSEREVIMAIPGRDAHDLPSMRLEMTLTSTSDGRILGQYVLEHSGTRT